MGSRRHVMQEAEMRIKDETFFGDAYGGTASIRKRSNGLYRLICRTDLGIIYHEDTYATYRGARIALGKVTGGMAEEVIK